MEMKLFKISMLSSLIFLSLYSYGDDYFDPTMLESQLGVDASQIDLSKFTATNSVPPGEYLITVEVNRNILGSKKVNFKLNPQGEVVPEFTPKLLEDWGVATKTLPSFNGVNPDTSILDLSKYIPDATVTPNIQNLRLTLTIPQIAMDNKVQGYIDPSLLDDGVPALFFNYFVSGNKSRNDANEIIKNENMFANIRAGLNAGPWRLRSNLAYSKSKGEKDQTSFSNT